MAMNKREQAEYKLAQDELANALALRWSRYEPLEPDLAVPSRDFTQGWYAYLDGSVEYMWSEPQAHGKGVHPNGYPRNASQNGRRLHSTELRALQASRYLLERVFAERLARIDKRIKELEQP